MTEATGTSDTNTNDAQATEAQSSDSHVTTRIDGTIYYVALDRPAKRNAITIDMLRDLADAVARADEHPEVRAVIVHGEGPVFSAGIDLNALGETAAGGTGQHPARALRRVAMELQGCLHRIESTELPVIGALHGLVLGLGLELALSFDLRVVGRECKFAFPESRLGLVADVGGTTRATRLIGPGRAKDMLMTCRRVGAEEALQWGLANRLTDEGEHLAGALALAEEISQNAPLAVGLAKFIVDQGEGSDRYTQMAIERLAQSQLIMSEDVNEAVASFVQKRPANYKGK